MRLQSIELIRREHGFFHFRDKLIPSVRPGDGVGVAVFFTPSALDDDFREVLGFQPYLWFPSVKEIEHILKAMDRSDEQTFQMLRTEWEGPRKMKVADFL
jgi:hypothetical protein